MNVQHFFSILNYKVFILTGMSPRQIGNSWYPTLVSEFFPDCKTSQQYFVFDNVLKTIFLYNGIAITVTCIYFFNTPSVNNLVFLLKHSTNYYGIVQFPNSPVKYFSLNNKFHVKNLLLTIIQLIG